MRKAGKFNARLMNEVAKFVKEGVSLNEIDQLVYEYTNDHGHVPAPLGYLGFPKSCCTSVNDVVCHGIPDNYILIGGDIVNVDVTTIVDGWHADQSETFRIGEVSETVWNLTTCAQECIYIGLEALIETKNLYDLGKAIQYHAASYGFTVVEAFQGHGLGRVFHGPPGVPHFPEYELEIKPGTAFTVEPMINEGSKHCVMMKDGWGVRTRDGKLSAQFEHTVLMTENGPEILTMRT